jgi:hypothetical protein
MDGMRTGSRIALLVALLAPALAAEAQMTYCKDIGGGKTYCTGGTVIHRHGNTTIIPQAVPAHPGQQLGPASPLLQNNSLPTLNAPYTGAGSQQPLSSTLPAPLIQPARPDAPGAPVIVIPPAGSRICHQFGTTLVCN